MEFEFRGENQEEGIVKEPGNPTGTFDKGKPSKPRPDPTKGPAKKKDKQPEPEGV